MSTYLRVAVVGALIAGVGAVLPVMVPGPTAGAVGPSGPRPLGVIWAHGSRHLSGAPAERPAVQSGAARVTPLNAEPPLLYHGGAVMGTTAAGVTVHPVYWVPGGYEFPDGFTAIMDTFLGDVAAGSGRSDNVINVTTQYSQRVGGNQVHVRGIVQAGAPVADADPYPQGSGACTPDPGVGFTACVTAGQMGSELTSLLARDGLPAGLADQYSIFFPPQVETCFDSHNAMQGGTCSSGNSAVAFCAFHSWTPGRTPIIFANMPWMGYCSTTPNSYPDGASAATATTSSVIHELTESMTDPTLGGWYDPNVNEIADECDNEFAFQPFGGEWWNIQYVFSNAAYQADSSGGCVVSLGAPSVQPRPLPGPVVGIASVPDGSGYWLVDAAGGVSPHGSAKSYGSMAGNTLNSAISHIVATSDGKGYWLVSADGGIFAFGDAGFFGSMGSVRLNAPVVDVAPTADGGGYWLVASDGGIFAFGDAAFSGSMGAVPLNQPVVGIAADKATGGYWEVAADGGIFAFDAPFWGSTGALRLNRPIVSMAAAPGATGYWFVASDGGMFAFHAPFQGSMGGSPLGAPVVGMAEDDTTSGYWMVGADGGVFSFGAPFYGSR